MSSKDSWLQKLLQNWKSPEGIHSSSSSSSSSNNNNNNNYEVLIMNSELTHIHT
jgi:hypothetical protein